eukprot:COSAG01_NODE_538_length_15761_cov_8.160388_9_plen_80_part_00
MALSPWDWGARLRGADELAVWRRAATDASQQQPGPHAHVAPVGLVAAQQQAGPLRAGAGWESQLSSQGQSYNCGAVAPV